jgi:AGCS family alanine or glycine:cation symporter
VTQSLLNILGKVSDFVWGPYLLIPLLLLTGFYLTILVRGIQFTHLWRSLWIAFVVRRESSAEGDISHFAALMTALAATVGTGNIVGVATAMALGGPGALFWMWMTALVGMATKYSEALLSVKYRVTDEFGEQAGGPMYYLERGLKQKKLGKILGVLFASFAAFAAFGIGNMVQANSVADAIHTSFGVPNWISGVVMAVLAAAVILGGIKSIGAFTSFLVPIMIATYMLGSGAIIALTSTNSEEPSLSSSAMRSLRPPQLAASRERRSLRESVTASRAESSRTSRDSVPPVSRLQPRRRKSPCARPWSR